MIRIGSIQRPHGLKGGLRLAIMERYMEDLGQAKVVFLEMRGSFAPYFVQELHMGSFPILQVEEVPSREAAAALTGKDLYLRPEDILPDEARTVFGGRLHYEGLIGFELWDAQLGRIGTIDELLDLPQQEVAQLSYQDREVLVPLHPQLIRRIDKAARQIHMDLPEGLLDL